MTRITSLFASLLAVAVLATGCASAPNAASVQTASAPADCGAIGAEITRTEQARRQAQEKEQDAWKVVVPFAVAARYAKGKAAENEADRRLDELNAQSQRQGCTRHVR